MSRKHASQSIMCSLLLAQSLPCLAQTALPVFVHNHSWTPPAVPVHQYAGQTNSSNYGSPGSNTSSPIHHHWTDYFPFSSHNGSATSSGTSNRGTNASNPNRTQSINASNEASNHASSVTQSGTSSHQSYTRSGESSNATLAGQFRNASQTSINLDLSSTNQSTTAGRPLGNGTVSISVGGAPLVVTAGTLLTTAEKVAVMQVLSTGIQSLVLDSQGSASGGSMTISPLLSQHLSSLVIPQGITVTDISKSGTLKLSGNLSDDGSLYVVTTNPALGTVVINAGNINVQTQGLISDLLPANSTFESLVPANLSLTLNAQNNVTNAGSIVSAGALIITAGGSIVNSPSASFNSTASTSTANASSIANAPTPVIHAAGDIDLASGSGNITNAGLIASTNGNINIAPTVANQNININGAGGTLQALNGAINVGDTHNAMASNINLSGGNYLSQNLNLYAGTGSITANVGQVSGALSTYGDTAHIFADTANLILGKNSINGDPTYASTGSITLTGEVDASASIAILAGGNILDDGNSVYISTDGSGGAITLIAGATLTNLGSSTTNPNISGTLVNSATVGFSSANGGSIDFTGGGLSPSGADGTGSALLDTSTTASGIAGGAVTLIAYSNSASSGLISLGTGSNASNSINTASYTSTAGAVTIVAGAPINTSIQTNNIVSGGTTGGAINIYTTQPSASFSATFATNGTTMSSLSPASIVGSNTPQYAAVTTGNLVSAGVGGAGGNGGLSADNTNGTIGGAAGAINVVAGGNVNINGSVEAFGGGGGGSNDGNGSAGNGGAGNNISISSALGTITITGDVNSSGGGGGGYAGVGTISTGGAAGNITISTAGKINIQGTVLAAGGGSGNDFTDYNGGGSFGGAGGGGSGGGALDTAGGGGAFGGGGGGDDGQGTYGSGGGGGGFGGSGGGGAGGGATMFGILEAGAGGGAGGNGTSGGDNGPPNTGVGGSGAGGGGAGGSSAGLATYGGNGGTGGTGTGSGASGGTDNFANGGNGGSSSAYNSTAAQNGFGVGAGNAGTSGSGGTVNITGQTVDISGKIGGSGPFAGESTNAQGAGGSVTIKTYGGTASTTTYQSNADYASGASTSSIGTITANASSLILAGSIKASSSITINGTGEGTSFASGTYSGPATLLISEGTNYVPIVSNALLTPAETIAAVEVSGGTSDQTLALSQTSNTTSPGTGYASGGSFAIAAANVPGTFTDLNLPSGVTENITATAVTYSSTSTVNGIIDDTGGSLQFNNTTNINGGSITTAGVQTYNGAVFLGAATTLSVTSNSNDINFSGTVDSATNGTPENLTVSAGSFADIGFLTNVGATNPLGTVTINGSSPVFFEGSVTSSSLTSNTLTNIEGGSITTTGNQTYNGNIQLSANTTLSSNGTITITVGHTLDDGTAGRLLQFAPTTAGSPVTVVNNGSIDLSGANSIVGFNGGANPTISLSGGGSLTASQVNFGDLSPTTSQFLTSYITLNPYTGSYMSGNISINQTITGAVNVPGSAPAPSPSATSSSAIASTFLSSTAPSLSSLPPSFFSIFLSLLEFDSFLQQQQALLNEKIGTRIATDYTPWTTYPMQPSLPLQGGIIVNELAMQATALGNALFAASEFNANELTALSQQGIVFGSKSNNNFLDLVKGFVLFMPTNNVQVQTREGLVYIPKGTAAWIMETGSDSAVYDLHDSLHTGHVKILVNGKDLTLSPGTEVLLTRNQTASFDSLNPGSAIAYRNVKSTDLGEGIKAFVCDYSIPHGLLNVPIIHSLITSPNAEEKKAAWKIIKNAVILADLTGSDYKTGQ